MAFIPLLLLFVLEAAHAETWLDSLEPRCGEGHFRLGRVSRKLLDSEILRIEANSSATLHGLGWDRWLDHKPSSAMLRKRHEELTRFKKRIELLNQRYPDSIQVDVWVQAYATMSDLSRWTRFFRWIYEATLTHRLQMTPIEESSAILGDLFQPNDDLSPRLLDRIARAWGWGPIAVYDIEFPEEKWNQAHLDNSFRNRAIAPGLLFYDRWTSKNIKGHTGTGHALQLLYLTYYLDPEYGRGTTRRLMKSMAQTPAHYELWGEVFDYDKNLAQNPMGLTFLSGNGIVRFQRSYLGLD